MAGRLHKSTNFEPVNKNQAGTLVTNATDVQFNNVDTWSWNHDDEWKDTVSGRFIMDVNPGMTLQSLNGGRRYKVTLTAQQYAKVHRFVFKFDAFDTSGGGSDYLFTVVTPRTANLVDVYGQSVVGLEIKGRFPEQITPANIKWVRRGAGEWRR